MGDGDSLLKVKREQAFGRHAVEIFVSSLEKAVKSSKIYEGDLSHPSLESVYRNVLDALRNAFDEKGQLELLIKPLEIIFDRKPVYSNSDRRTSLSYALFTDGIRFLSFREGFSLEELKTLVQILGTDFTKPEFMDQDAYGLIIEARFEYFQATSIDLLAQMTKEDAALKERMQSFLKSVSTRTMPRVTSVARNLRPDDLKILEEFRLNPKQFAKPDEEVSRVIQSVIHHQNHVAREKEVLEKMLWMGLHVLLHSSEIPELEAGRSLIVSTALDLVEQSHLATFKALIERLHGFQREQPAKTGELQKVLDSIFHPEHAPLFAPHLKEGSDEMIKLLSGEPPSSVARLLIELLGERPQLTKILSDFYLKNVAQQASWLEASFQRNPEGKAWEPLLSLVSQKAFPSLRVFLEAVLQKGNSGMKAKAIRALALIGSPESLRPLQSLLRSKDEALRIIILHSIASVKTRPTVLLIKAHIESPLFEEASELERAAALQALVEVAEETALPWLQSFWSQSSGGLFKRRQENSRRILLIKALGRRHPSFIELLIKQTPGLSEEVLAEWQKVQKGSGV